MSNTAKHTKETDGTTHTPSVLSDVTPSQYRHLLPQLKPHKYNDEQINNCFNYVEEQIGLYGKALNELCREEKTPSKQTFTNWVKVNPRLSDRYAHAQLRRVDYWAEEIIEIADNSNLDYGFDKFNNIIVIGEAVQRSRVRIDSRKWLMSRLNPAKYGDKVNHELTGLNGGTIKVESIDYSELSDSAIREILKATNKPNETKGLDDSI